MIAKARARSGDGRAEPAKATRPSPDPIVSLPHLCGWLVTAFPPVIDRVKCDACNDSREFVCGDCEGTGKQSVPNQPYEETCDACGGDPEGPCEICVHDPVRVDIVIVLGMHIERGALLAAARRMGPRVPFATLRKHATMVSLRYGNNVVRAPRYVPGEHLEEYTMLEYPHEQLPLRGVA